MTTANDLAAYDFLFTFNSNNALSRPVLIKTQQEQ